MTHFSDSLLSNRIPAKRLGGALLWLIAAVHMALLAAFLLVLTSLSPAGATTLYSCGGANLLEIIKRDEPARYAQLIGEAEKTANGKSIFWKIEKPGIEPSFLLGTMHLSDPRVLGMPPAAAQANAESRTIIVESDEILDDRKAAIAIMAKPELTMFADGKSITDFLSSEDAARLEAGLKEKGIALSAISRMTPWMVAGVVSLPACEFARKAKGADFLDKKIAVEAANAGKSVRGLETLSEQLQAMSELPMEFHLRALIETLELGGRLNDIMETMTLLYLSGDIGMTMPMLKAVTPQSAYSDEAGYAAFEERIITRRNHVMAERAAPILAGGAVFMAVGALHLPGQEGLVELLRQQGFTVSAVN